MTKVQIASINTRVNTQSRAQIDTDTVTEYADAINDSQEMPPVILFKDGDSYFIGDGWHRVLAHKKLDRKTIEATIKKGGKREALLFAAGANAGHGLRRSNADKRHAVEMLLGDKEWGKWADREIARRCVVSHEMVRQVRASLSTDDSEPTERKFVHRNGKEAVMQPRAVVDKDDLPPPADVEVVPPPADIQDLPPSTVDSEPPPEPVEEIVEDDPYQPKSMPEGADQFVTLFRKVSALNREIQDLAATPLGGAIRHQQIDIDLNNVGRAIKFAAPYRDCPNTPNCKNGCAQCQGRGWVTKEVWDRIPEELKK